MAVYAKRKTVKGLVAFSVRIDPDIKTELEKIAYNERKSLGLIIEEILEREITDRKIVQQYEREHA